MRPGVTCNYKYQTINTCDLLDKHLTRFIKCCKMGGMYSFVKDSDGEIIATTQCLDCRVSGIELHSRGLCMNCYQANRRAGSLGEFPTAYFLNNPEEYVHWAVTHFPELVKREIYDQHGVQSYWGERE